MALTEIQNSMVRLLKVCEMTEEGVMGVMLSLQQDEQLKRLAYWIGENPNATQNEIIRMAISISEEDGESI